MPLRRQRPSPAPRKARVLLEEVPYDQCSAAQRAAWDWLWRRLLGPVPTPETRKAPGALTHEASADCPDQEHISTAPAGHSGASSASAVPSASPKERRGHESTTRRLPRAK